MTEPRRGRAWRASALLLLMAAGAILAGLPHLASWLESGDPTYLADGDGLLYLAWSRGIVLGGDPGLTDAIHRASGPMMHPWLLFVPPARLARGLGLGMSGLGMVWRLMAGVSIPLALFASLRPATRTFGLAVGLATFLMFDSGLMFGQVVRRDFEVMASLVAGDGRFLDGVPYLMPHLRVVTPGLALTALLLHHAACLRARLGVGSWVSTQPTTTAETSSVGWVETQQDRSRQTRGWHPRGWVVMAGLTFGLLFHVYFYFWTMVGLGLVLAIALDRRGRKIYLTILLVGLALGLPALWSGSMMKRSTPPDWLWRTNKFVPIGRFEGLLWPKVLVAEWLAVSVWVFRSRRELIYPWACVGAGLLLLNQQVFTGLELENEHWTAGYGITFSLLLACLASPLVERAWGSRRGWRWAIAAALAAQVAVGLGLRWVEASRSAESLAVARLYRDWRDDPVLRGLPAGSVVSGDPAMLSVAAAMSEVRPLYARIVEFSSKADDRELDERLLLNVFLTGVDAAEARRRVDLPPGSMSWEAGAIRSPAMADRQRDRRRGLVDSIWADPRPWIARFEVEYVVLPASSGGDHLAGLATSWRVGTRSRAWKLDRPGKSAD